MNRTLGRRRGAVAPVVLALCLPLLAAGQNQKPTPVTVVNPDAIPVPVKAVGALPVTFADKASVPVTGTVRITETVPVNISGTVPVNIAGSPNVNIANATAANPLSVIMTKEPIDLLGFVAAGVGSPGGTCVVQLFDVPTGKRLVVEQVTGRAEVSKTPSAAPEPVYLFTGADIANPIMGVAAAFGHYLEPKLLVGSQENALLVSQQVRIYVQPGNRLSVVWGLGNYTRGCNVRVTGYLEPE